MSLPFWPFLALHFFAQSPTLEPVKTSLCEIVRHPETFTGKLVQIRALVESGVDDLPAGLSDDTCGAELKFLTPDDQHFARLLKSKDFRKLIKEVKKNPLVEATITGLFRRTGADDKQDSGLALESVENVVAKPLPKIPRHRNSGWRAASHYRRRADRISRVSATASSDTLTP